MTRKCSNCARFERTGERNQEIRFPGFGRFDIDIALGMARRTGRPLVELDPPLIRRLLREREINEQHIEHVKASKPGILAVINCKYMLIEGAHRARKNLDAGRSFFVWTLTDSETRRLLERSNPKKRKCRISEVDY